MMIACCSIIFMCVIVIISISVVFPIFLSVYYTLRTGILDLGRYLICLMCIMLGAAYYMTFYYGPHSHARSSASRGFLQIGYSYFASEIKSFNQNGHDDEDRITALVSLIFIIVLYLLITFTLVNLFISVVIVRYRFLRSMIQEKSTASFYIIKERVEIILDLLLYLLLFKKPQNLENDEQFNDPTQGDNLSL